MAAATTTTLPDTSKCHDPNFALQKYLLLQTQHETLQHHLDEMRPAPPRLSPTASMTSTMSTVSSPEASPTFGSSPFSRARRQRTSGGGGGGGGSHRERRQSSGASSYSCLETIIDETTLHRLASEEQKLYDVNEGIKRALTELLNCDMVREDKAFRTWVQGRLMETERELRSGRRKRSAPSLE